MRHKLYEIGQAVTPNVNEDWVEVKSKINWFIKPKFGEIYHVLDHDFNFILERWYISLKEIDNTLFFVEMAFSPVISIDELQEELSQIAQPQEA